MDTSNDKLAERRQTQKVVHPTSFLVAYHFPQLQMFNTLF